MPGDDAVTVSTVLAVRYSSPLIGTDMSALTAAVETENAALVAPAGTVTLTGTVAALVFELKSSTTAPPAGAALLSVTVPVDELPPVTRDGLRATEMIGGTGAAGGPTVSARLFALAPYVAVTDTGIVAVADLFVMNVNVLVVEPVETTTLVGSDENSSG